MRSALIHSAVALGTARIGLLADEAALTGVVRQHAGGTWHPSGTCRMGAPEDPLAVTTPTGWAFGVEARRVRDTSVMPSIPCANTCMPTRMNAGRIADLIRREAP